MSPAAAAARRERARSLVAGPRRVAWWLASPFAYAGLQVARQSRCRVLSGPFAGMRYPLSFVPRLLFGAPYQVGSFECELHPTIERIVAGAPAVVVNVGSAEGYYAVGLARLLPRTTVVAYEAEPRIRAAGVRLAALNGVDDRIEPRGTCTAQELARLAERVGDASVCVIMDCEGCEAALADPEAVPWLARASLLIELHPSVDPEIGLRLGERLARTHELETIRSRPRRASAFPDLAELRGLRRIDRELLVAEYRNGGQEWLWAVARRPPDRGAAPPR